LTGIYEKLGEKDAPQKTGFQFLFSFSSFLVLEKENNENRAFCVWSFPFLSFSSVNRRRWLMG